MSTMTGINLDEVVDVAPPLGTVIHGKYRLQQMIGEGAFAWVYAAQHETIESLRFAVKVLKPTYAQNPDILRRFKREAVTVANLQSRHTVRIFDFGVSEGGLPYIVMEYINGLAISQLLKRDGALSPLQACRITLGVLGALEDAHSLGIVHRDLKPSNVIITKPTDETYPIAKVLDFGIAKVLAGDDKPSAGADETVEGLLFCSPRYASPEILLGKPSLQSDLYSLGTILAEMIEGEAPYGGDNNILVAAQHLGPDPVPIGEEVEKSGLGNIVRRACEKDTDSRYQSATEMMEDVQKIYDSILQEIDESALEIDLTLPESMRPPPPPSGPLLREQLENSASGQPPYTQPMPKPIMTGPVPRMDQSQPGMSGSSSGVYQTFNTDELAASGSKSNPVVWIVAIVVIAGGVFGATQLAGSNNETAPPPAAEGGEQAPNTEETPGRSDRDRPDATADCAAGARRHGPSRAHRRRDQRRAQSGLPLHGHRCVGSSRLPVHAPVRRSRRTSVSRPDLDRRPAD